MRPVSRLSRSPRPNWRERERDPSRTLPPLLPTRPSSSNALPPFWGHPDMPQPPMPMPYRSLSPEQRFTPLRPFQPGPRPSLHLPPPFTLQPNPHWNEPAYLPRPSSWPGQESSQFTRPRSMSPLAPRRDFVRSSNRGGYSSPRHVAERGLSAISSEPSHSGEIPSRSGRYDPIRSTYIPYSPNPATPMMPQDRRPRGAGQTDRDDRPLSRSR
jgi:hypothetical protein